jgi:hypothetical protein
MTGHYYFQFEDFEDQNFTKETLHQICKIAFNGNILVNRQFILMKSTHLMILLT